MTAENRPMIIDAHQHVWDPTRAEYDWLANEPFELNRRIDFDEVIPSFARAGIQGSILVEAADNDEDTQLMLDTAHSHSEVVGIVAYAPLDQAVVACTRLLELRHDPLLVGVRNLIHNNPDPDWLLRPDVDEGLGVLEELGLAFDLVSVLPRHLQLVPELVRRHPTLRIVIDHLSKPPIDFDDRQPWWDLIERAAESETVTAKVSGLYSATAESGAWTAELIRPFFSRALGVFGAERLMYGGDWPISIPAGGYDAVWDGLSALFADLSDRDRNEILGGTATRFYRLDGDLLDAAARAGRASA